jgi:hypothetical protein
VRQIEVGRGELDHLARPVKPLSRAAGAVRGKRIDMGKISKKKSARVLGRLRFADLP